MTGADRSRISIVDMTYHLMLREQDKELNKNMLREQDKELNKNMLRELTIYVTDNLRH